MDGRTCKTKYEIVKIDENIKYVIGVHSIEETICVSGEKYFIEKEIPFTMLIRKESECERACKRFLRKCRPLGSRRFVKECIEHENDINTGNSCDS